MVDILISGPEGKIEAQYSHNNKDDSPIVILLHPDPSKGGTMHTKIIFKHILPNALTPIITFAPFSIIADIGTLVSLDFLGYGLRPPTSSWGNLLSQAAENLYNWHMLVFPVIVLTATIFMITFISEAVREAFDPRVYSRLR